MSIAKDSSTYQLILDESRMEGKAEEAKAFLLRLGRKRLGPLEKAQQALLEAITDLDRLERMSERLLEVENWDELLTTP